MRFPDAAHHAFRVDAGIGACGRNPNESEGEPCKPWQERDGDFAVDSNGIKKKMWPCAKA